MSISIRPTTPVVRKPVTVAQKPVTPVETKPVTAAKKPVAPAADAGTTKNIVKWGATAAAAAGGAYGGWFGGSVVGVFFAMAGFSSMFTVLPIVGMVAGAAAAGGGVYALTNWLTKKF